MVTAKKYAGHEPAAGSVGGLGEEAVEYPSWLHASGVASATTLGIAVRHRRGAEVVGVGEGGLDDRIQTVVADVSLDGGLPVAGVRPDLRAGGTDVGG